MTENNEPKFTSEPRTPERDEEIVTQAENYFADKKDAKYADYFDYALDNGASPLLLGRCAELYFEGEKDGVKLHLPYVGRMLAAGFDKETVRQIIATRCFSGECTYGHRHEFFVEERNWEVFDSVDSLKRMLLSLVESEAERLFEYHMSIAEAFGRRRDTGLDKAWKNHEYVVNIREKMQAAGQKDMLEVVAKAAEHIGRPCRNIAISYLEKMPDAIQLKAAYSMVPDHRTIPFIMGVHVRLDYWRDGLVRKVTGEMIDRPHRAVAIYRWAMLGIHNAGKQAEWQQSRFYDDFRRRVELEGKVKFAKLTSRERNRQPGKFDLQYEVVEAGCKIVVCHEERGTRGEILREGDEVIVPARIPSAWSPVFQSDDRKFKIYRQELQAAGPPTHKMQHSPKDEYFYIPDPVPPQGPVLPKRRAW